MTGAQAGRPRLLIASEPNVKMTNVLTMIPQSDTVGIGPPIPDYGHIILFLAGLGTNRMRLGQTDAVRDGQRRWTLRSKSADTFPVIAARFISMIAFALAPWLSRVLRPAG